MQEIHVFWTYNLNKGLWELVQRGGGVVGACYSVLQLSSQRRGGCGRWGMHKCALRKGGSVYGFVAKQRL